MWPHNRPRGSQRFIAANGQAIRIDTIQWIDASDIEKLRVVIHHSGKETVAEGPSAIEVVMLLKPELIEGKRLRFVRHAWMIHNLIGHPGMQLLAFLGQYKLAFRLHDATVPVPRPKAK